MLRVIDEKGENLGIITKEEALKLAQQRNLDLILISEKANPPVAKIINFDKFRYQEEKKLKNQKKANKIQELKTIRISPRMALNDIKIKINQVEKFLKKGHKIEIVLYMKGREKANKDWALEKLNYFLQQIPINYQITTPIKESGKGFSVQLIIKK